jgi:hypothetical protein
MMLLLWTLIDKYYREKIFKMSDLMGCMKKLVVVSVFLVLSLGIGVGATTSFVLGQGANMTNSTSMNQTGTNMSAPETDLNAVPGNDTQVLENDTSIGNPNNTVLNSMSTNENQSN